MKEKYIILIVVLVLIVRFILRIITTIGILIFLFLVPFTSIDNISNYDKDYIINKYGGDLDSNLSIFPSNKSILYNSTFNSTFNSGIFDTEGYIFLKAKYNEEDFLSEINRLGDISIAIYESCYNNSQFVTKTIQYDDFSYNYPAYIAIDGFDNKYEYALINKDNMEIIYVYLSYPDLHNLKDIDYLKKDISVYYTNDTLDLFSMYNHSFNNGISFSEFDDC